MRVDRPLMMHAGRRLAKNMPRLACTHFGADAAYEIAECFFSARPQGRKLLHRMAGQAGVATAQIFAVAILRLDLHNVLFQLFPVALALIFAEEKSVFGCVVRWMRR